MPIKIKEFEIKRPQVDLYGPEGNIFCLWALSSKWAKDLDWEPEAIKAFSELLKSQDYDFAVRCIMQAFEEWVDFVIPEKDAQKWMDNKNIPVEWPVELCFLEKTRVSCPDQTHDEEWVQKIKLRRLVSGPK